MKKNSVAVVGASGYSGIELLRILMQHPMETGQRKDAAGKVHWDRAYAMTNPMEYFAEGTEAFFSRNDFFPFNRDELRQHDPGLDALLSRLWGRPG